jgi:hypothetical protein
MKKALSLAVLVFLFVMCAGIANAFVIFDNMPGNVYDGTSGATVSGPTSPIGTNYAAQMFTVGDGDCTLTSIEIPAWVVMGTPSISVSLLADDGGVPGSLIESFGAMNISNGIYQFNSATNPLLYNIQNYWVAVYPGGPDTWAAWNLSDNYIGLWAYDQDGNGWVSDYGTEQAMRVNADIVPEPASLMMLLCGAGALGGMFLRRRK